MLYSSFVENLWPDCVTVELEAIPGDAPSPPSSGQTMAFNLRVNFGQHLESVLGGKIRLGLTGSQLNLHITGGHLGEGHPGISPEMVWNCQVRNEGKEICWEMTSPQGALASLVEVNPLVVLISNAEFCQVEFRLMALPRHWQLLEVEGLWPHDITPNQHAVLERTLVQFLKTTRFQPWLSRVIIPWDGPVSNDSFGPELEKLDPRELEGAPVEETAPTSEQELQETVNRIKNSPQANFLALVQWAGLDPRKDFSGSGLRGAELSGLDLSGADLSYANLRGANLCDADLSDANLSYARLGGADLSGAYLGNACLSHADFHRASLALANVGGADFTGANLLETNLSSTNFHHVTVNEARFGQNPGLSSEDYHELLARGAIVEEKSL